MSKSINDRKLFALYHKIGLKYNLTDSEIKELAESPYEFTKEKLDQIDLDTIETEEDFNNVKTNFIYKFLGKIYTSFALIKAKKTKSETYKEINKRRWKK
jgi:hypothetical protein